MKTLNDIIQEVRSMAIDDLFNQDNGHLRYIGGDFGRVFNDYDEYIEAIGDMECDEYGTAQFNLGYEHALLEVERKISQLKRNGEKFEGDKQD